MISFYCVIHILPGRHFAGCFLAFLLMSLLALSETPKSVVTTKDKPVMELKERQFDFGLLPPNKATVLQHDFFFKNSGNRPLEIKSVGTACRTVTSSPKMEALAGDGSFIRLTTTLPVDYTSTEQFERTVKVETNDPEHPSVELSIKARFAYSLHCQPERIDFGALAAGDVKEQQLSVVSLSDKPFQIRRCECDGATFKTTLEKIKYDPGLRSAPGNEPTTTTQKMSSGYKVTIRAKPGVGKDGLMVDTLRLYTDREDIPVISVPMTAKVIPAIVVEPTNLFLGIIRSSDPIETDVNLQASLKDFKISEVTSTLKGLEIEQFGRVKGIRIHLTYHPGEESHGLVEGDLIIRTNQPSAPEIKIKIQGVLNLKPVKP